MKPRKNRTVRADRDPRAAALQVGGRMLLRGKGRGTGRAKLEQATVRRLGSSLPLSPRTALHSDNTQIPMSTKT
jgi:hypothetical protein